MAGLIEKDPADEHGTGRNPAAHPSLWQLRPMRSMVWLCMIAFVSFFVTLSALPLWAVAGGAKSGAGGLVTTVMLISTVGVQTLVPLMIRRFGSAPVLACGLVALGGPAPFYLLHHELWWLLIISGLRGFGFAIITVLLPIMATQIAPPGRYGEAIGIYGLAIAVPNLLAVPGGVALTTGGYFPVVAVLAAAPLLALPLVRRASHPGRASPRTQPGLSGTGRTLLRISGVTLVLLAATLAGGGLLTFLPIERPQGPLATVALLLFGASAALARWRSGLLADRIGHRILLPLGLVIAVAGLVLVAVGLTGHNAGAASILLVGAAATGVGYGAVQNLTLLMAFSLAGPARHATASAAWNAAFDTGTALGALVVGAVAAGGLGLSWTYVLCAGLLALTLPLAWSGTAPTRLTKG